MPGTMNHPICLECGLEVEPKVVDGCWTDAHTADHLGLCCDCYDVSLGAPPPVKWAAPQTATRQASDEDEEV